MQRNLVQAVVGLLALLAALGGLGLNEWQAGGHGRATILLEERVHDVDPSGPIPQGEPVRIVGRASTAQVLTDPVLPVRSAALRLDRHVELYQWREIVEGTGTNRSIRHEAVWSAEPIDSTRFLTRAPVNPGALPLPSLRLYASDARLGEASLGPEVLDRLPADPLRPPPQPSRVETGALTLRVDGAGYQSGDPVHPVVGDVRVRFSAVLPEEITVVGTARNGVLGPWQAPDGTPILLAARGTQETSRLVATDDLASLPRLWGARFIGGIAAFIGFALLWEWLPLRLVLGHKRAPGAIMAAVGTVALAVALGWALFRTPLLGP